MSLMQFLTVGRSFGGAKEGPNRYRVNEQCLLPKFGKPNPTFRTTTLMVAPKVAADRSRIGVGETGSLFDLQPPRPPGNECFPATRSARQDSTPVVPPVRSSANTHLGEPPKPKDPIKAIASIPGNGKDTLNRRPEVAQAELPVVPAPNPFATPSAPAVVTDPSRIPPPKKRWQWLLEGMLYTRRKNVSTRRAPVQREWSLGGVTVVRNDLSDADLEVVPATAVRSESARRPAAETVSPNRSLAALSGRWIGWLLQTGRVRF